MNQSKETIFNKPPQSFWMATTPQPDYPTLDRDIKIDVAIIGGGFAGLACAYMLSKEGVKTCLLEADQILQGTTGHTTAKITSQHGLIYHKIKAHIGEEIAKQYADANQSAIKMVEQIISDHKIDCDFIHQSAHIYTHKDEYIQQIRSEVDTASSLGIEACYLDEIPLSFPIKAAIRFDNQAQFHPRKFLLPLAKIASDKGTKIFEQTRVIDIDKGRGNCILTTANGNKITANRVVIATHYPFYNKNGEYLGKLSMEKSYAIGIKAKEKYPGGMYITAEEPGRSFRNQPDGDGELIIIGGEHHLTGKGEDMVKHYETLIDLAKQMYTVNDIPYRWSAQDCMTLDDIPYIGHFAPDTPNIFVTTGYKKWGMTTSIVSAMLLKDLIVHGKSAWEEAFNPSRKTAAISGKYPMPENPIGIEQATDDKGTTRANSIRIVPGEGKIVETKGERAGVYRDEKGKLYAVDTTCPHMGCNVVWNSAEHTWDCPCHGSRYSYKGHVVEGPTIKGLDSPKDLDSILELIMDDY